MRIVQNRHRFASARLAPRWRICGEELVDALVGDAKNRSSVSHADSSFREGSGGSTGLLEGESVSVLCLFSSASSSFNRLLRRLGQHWMGNEQYVVFLGLEPQGGGFAHAAEGLLNGLSPAVDAWFFFKLDTPTSVRLPFQAGGVGPHGRLLERAGVCQRLSHFRPKHVSRSRSMALRIPAVMSPAWSGITVWQSPQRHVWCDPRWRTGSQRNWRSWRINVRASRGRAAAGSPGPKLGRSRMRKF